jgi:hypothetical protein
MIGGVVGLSNMVYSFQDSNLGPDSPVEPFGSNYFQRTLTI